MPNWNRFTPTEFEADHYRVATMNKQRLTEAEIDAFVIAEADDLAQWDDPILVEPSPETMVALPASLTARARFFAKLHKKSSLEEWLQTIIQERIAFEESAYTSLLQAISQ